MFIYAPRVILVSALSSLITASAMPNIARGGRPGPSICANGSPQCCSQAIAVNQTSVDLTRFGVNETVNVAMGTILGIQCSPITLVGVGSVQCTQQVLCCGGALSNGLVDVNCTAVSISV